MIKHKNTYECTQAESERGREREGEREREGGGRQTDRQTDRQTNRHTEREREREREILSSVVFCGIERQCPSVISSRIKGCVI